jgi:two-component system C4-dicarboxylate transport response regulator DctD
VCHFWHKTGFIAQKTNFETNMKTKTDTSFKFTVLFVEDDDKFRTHFAQLLRGESFEIVEANSGSQACALIRQRKISLVVLDWDLHNSNSSTEDPSTGLKVLRTCHEVDPLLPVVVISGEPLLDPRDDSMMEGADCFLQKPFPPLLLIKHLRRWMGRVKAEKNPFTQLTAGAIETADTVNRAYTRAVVDMVGSVLQAAPKLGLSRQTVASYLASAE